MTLAAARAALLDVLRARAAALEDELRADFERLRALRWDTEKANTEFEAARLAAILAAVQVEHPKVKDLKKAEKAAPELVERLREEWRQKAEQVVARHTAWKKRRDGLLYDIAAELTPRRSPGTWTKVEEFHEGDYRSTGSGATYATARAELYAEGFQAHGLPVRVVPKQTPSPLAGTIFSTSREPLRSWAVEVEAIPLDCEIAKRRPMPGEADDLVAFVRGCWERAVNPRVFLPTLPWGFEERHGISFQARPRRG